MPVVLPSYTPPVYAPPDDLPAPAAELWTVVVAELVDRGLKPGDLEAVRMMCMAAYRAREASHLVAQLGILMETERGLMLNPAVRVEKDAAATYQRLAEAFGLTLASRTRLGLLVLSGQSLMAQLEADLDA